MKSLYSNWKDDLNLENKYSVNVCKEFATITSNGKIWEMEKNNAVPFFKQK